MSEQLNDLSAYGRRVPYALEVMKNGQIVETRQLQGKEYFTFGRSPQSDVSHLHSPFPTLMLILVPSWPSASCLMTRQHVHLSVPCQLSLDKAHLSLARV